MRIVALQIGKIVGEIDGDRSGVLFDKIRLVFGVCLLFLRGLNKSNGCAGVIGVVCVGYGED